MKKLFSTLLVLTLLVGLTSCSVAENKNAADEAQDVSSAVTAETEIISSPEAEIVKKLMDSIGPDLTERAKAAGFKLQIEFQNYIYEPYDGWEPTETQNTNDVQFVIVELRSAVGTTVYGNNTVDTELMREIQCAVIDSNIFDLKTEDINMLKTHYYTPENRYVDIDVISNDGSYVELFIDETPGGYEAILYLRDQNRHERYASMTNNAHRLQKEIVYEWGELAQ